MNNVQAPIGNHKFNVILGIIGLLIAIAGNFVFPGITQKWFYFVSVLFLITVAVLERQQFFIFLELILLVGTSIAFFAISDVYKAGLPILVSIIIIFYLISKTENRNFHSLLGCLGIAFLGAGFAILNPIIYLIGGATLAIYSWISYRKGVDIALIWAVLNAIFAVTALLSVYRHFLN